MPCGCVWCGPLMPEPAFVWVISRRFTTAIQGWCASLRPTMCRAITDLGCIPTLKINRFWPRAWCVTEGRRCSPWSENARRWRQSMCATFRLSGFPNPRLTARKRLGSKGHQPCTRICLIMFWPVASSNEGISRRRNAPLPWWWKGSGKPRLSSMRIWSPKPVTPGAMEIAWKWYAVRSRRIWTGMT